MQYLGYYQSPLGDITIASDGEHLTGLWFDGQKYDRDIVTKEAKDEDLEVFAQTKKWLDIYFQGKDPGFTPPIKLEGSDFHNMVADIMLSIPYGKTMTYGEIAAEVAKRTGRERMSAQAVGGAVGHNSVSVIIPCHRVVGAKGSLTGYAGGISKKIALLELENAWKPEFFVPKKGTAL